MREFLKSPLVQTLEVWKSLEPEMTKEAEITWGTWLMPAVT